MKKLLALILALLMMVAVFAACDDPDSSSSSSSSESSSSSDSSSSSSDPDESSSSSAQDDKKYPDVPKIDYNVNINQTVNSNVFASLDSFGNEGEAESYSNATNLDVSVGITHISTPGVYHLSGTTTKGYVKVDIDRPNPDAPLQEVILILDNVSITSYSDASSIPPIYSKGCNLTIILPKNSVNTITDTKTNLEKSAIYVKTGNLTIDGEGTLKVNGTFKSAIFNTKTLTINGGVFDLFAEYHAVYGKEGLVINSGDFTTKTGKSALKSGEYEVTNEASQNVLGSITVNGGKFTLNATGNAIDAYGSVTINGGGFNIETAQDGINATGDIVFGDNEKNTVMIIDAKETGIKGNSKVDTADGQGIKGTSKIKIGGKTNIKITTVTDGIDGYDIEIDTLGVIYIKTNAKFVEDMSHGEYILDNKEYHKVDRDLFTGKAFFSIKGSAKGVRADNSIVIKAGQIGIDSDEDCIVSTDGKNGDSATVNTIQILGGSLNLDSRESAIKADNTITVAGAAKVNIIKSDKGLNAREVNVGGGTIIAVAISDAIDATRTTVTDGTLYLFDKVDTKTGGEFTVTGGTLVCLSTTNNPKEPTSCTNKLLATSIVTPDDYVFGNYINIKGSDLDIVLKIPKSYAEKLSVVVTSSDVLAGSYTISVGSFTNGSVSNLVCTDGVFTAISTQNVTVE